MRSNFANLLRAFAAAMVLSCLSLTLAAQSAGNGAIAGTVTDSAGALIPNVTVVITDTDTGATRTVTTSSDGSFKVPFLQPGHYEVILGGGEFAKVDRKNLLVTVGDTLTLDTVLPAASVETQVVVTTDAPLLDTQKVESSQTIDQNVVSNLPVNGRRFDNFVLLTPNVAPDGNTGLISYRGVSGLYNTNLVDGANNNQAFFSEARGRSIGAPYVYPIDSIREFQSSSTGYSAELGGAAGGIINAITKSGTNQFHGDVYEYYRTPGFNALDAVAKTSYRNTGNTLYLEQPVKVQHQFGISMGGPILQDKLFFHFTYDGYRKVNPIVYTSTYNSSSTNVANLVHLCDGGATPVVDAGATYPTTIPNITPSQCSAAVAYLQTQLGSFGRNVRQDVYFPRLDYQLTSKTHVSASFLFENFQQPNGYNGAVTVSNGGISQNGANSYHERFLVVNAETLVSSRSANVVHFQWSRDLETAGTNSAGPANNLTNLVQYGETSALPRAAFPDEHRWQFTDVYSRTAGRHSIKMGFDLNFIHEQIANLFGGDGAFNYSNSLPEINFANWVQDIYGINATRTYDPTSNTFAAGPVRHYNSFTQTVDQITGNGADDFWNRDFDGFLQDDWKITSNLLLSAGIRYDVQIVPGPDRPNTTNPVALNATSQINPDLKMLQPRLGFVWNPVPGTVVRGGYGIFYGLVSNSAYYTLRRENGVYQRQYGPINAAGNTSNGSGAPVPYVAAGAALTAGGTCTPTGGANRCYDNPASYLSYAPVGGVPIYPPPGPAPANQVTGTAITPTGLSSVPSGTITIRGLDPSFRNPQSHSADLAVEQVLPLRTTLTISYVGNRGIRLPIYVDTNVDPASVRNDLTYKYTAANGAVSTFSVPVYTNRLYTTTGIVATGFSDVNSWYHSFVASVRKPLDHGVEILANYTWAKAMDDGQASGTNGTFNGTDAPLIPFALGPRKGRGAEYARSDLDQRGRFVGTLLGTTKLPVANKFIAYATNGWELSGTYTAQTGFPVTGFVSGAITSLTGGKFGTLNDGGVTNAVFTSGTSSPPIVGGVRVPDQIARRNSFAGPGVHNLDARVAREFPFFREGMHIELAAEAFNLVNHRNILAVNNFYVTYTAPTAGSATCPTNASNTALGCFTPFAQFGTPVTTSNVLYGERQLQLLARLYF